MNPYEVTIIMFAGMMVLMCTGLPIAFCIGSIGVLAAFMTMGVDGLSLVYFSITALTSNIVLTAIPLFVFMGFMLYHSGVAEGMFDTIYKWAGGIRGALGIGTIGICALMAAMIGVSSATVLALGAIVVPSMLAKGYNKHMTLGLVMSGGALGFLIPPSVMMVMYGFLSTVSVGQLFAGGVIPGLMLAVFYMIYVAIRCALRPEDGPALPPEERASWKEKFISLKDLIPPLFLAAAILISIFSGFASPTEAAALGAGFSMICAALRRNLTWKVIWVTLQKTFELSGFVAVMIIAALAFSKAYSSLGATIMIRNFVMGLDVSPWVIIIIMQLSFFMLGMFLDDIAILFMCMPIYVPIIKGLGFDPIWFGVLYVMNMQMAYLTPPYGLNLFFMKAVAPKNVSITDLYVSVIPFLFIQLAALILLMFFPDIVMYLPRELFAQ